MSNTTPNDWIKYRLKDVVSVLRNGANIKQEDNALGTPISRIETISNGEIDLNRVGFANIFDDKYKDYYVKKGDILFSHINSVPHLGKCAICNFVDIKLIHGMNLLLLRANEKIYSKFLFYLLKSQQFKTQLPSITKKSVNQASISTTNLGNLVVYIPPTRNEQQEIVDILDAMSDIIRLRKECIEHAQALIPALFQEMFGNSNNNVSNSKIVRLGECIELNPAKPSIANNLNVTFLGMKDVSENGQVDLSTTKTYEEVKKGFTNFENNDVLLAKITPCFENGKAAIVRNLTNGYGFGSTEFYVLRANQNIILPEYVYSIIKSFAFAIPGRQKMTGAAGQKRLPKGYILNYKIPLPDLELQRLYAKKLNEINSYIKEQQEELKNANQIFQSLLHHAFTGELTRRAYGKD